LSPAAKLAAMTNAAMVLGVKGMVGILQPAVPLEHP
jgi:hypothetical protein